MCLLKPADALILFKTDNCVFFLVSQVTFIIKECYQKKHDEVLAISFKIEVD